MTVESTLLVKYSLAAGRMSRDARYRRLRELIFSNSLLDNAIGALWVLGFNFASRHRLQDSRISGLRSSRPTDEPPTKLSHIGLRLAGIVNHSKEVPRT